MARVKSIDARSLPQLYNLDLLDPTGQSCNGVMGS